MRPKLAILATTAFLAGCSTVASAPVGFNDGSLVSTRKAMGSDETIQSVFASKKPVAFVILDNDDPGRNKKICEAFNKLPTAVQVGDLNPNATPVPTFWFVKSTGLSANAIQAMNCTSLLAEYDQTRADTLAMAYHLKPSAAYILAVDGNGKSFYINMNNGSKSQLANAMRSWFTVAAANDATGMDLKEVWRKVAEKLGCDSGFIHTVFTSVFPGWVGSLLGLAQDAAGCHVETPPQSAPNPTTVIA